MLCHFCQKMSEKGAGRGYSSQHVKRFGPEDVEIKCRFANSVPVKLPVFGHTPVTLPSRSRHTDPTKIAYFPTNFAYIRHGPSRSRHGLVTLTWGSGLPKFSLTH